MTEVARGAWLWRLPPDDVVATDAVMPVSSASLHDGFSQEVASAGLVESSAQLGRG